MAKDIGKLLSIPGMLLFGTSTVVIQKMIFSMNGEGRHGDEHLFKKPWFQTEAMFVGMMLCLIVYWVKKCRGRMNEVSAMENAGETAYESLLDSSEKKAPVSEWKKYVYVMAPAMCDLVATCFMNIGLLCIPASVWQMLRGSMVVFSAILSIIFLKRKLHGYNWFGIMWVVLGLLVVAFACIKGNSVPNCHPESSPDPSSSEEMIGIILVVLAQIVQASQIVIEEFLLKNVKADPFLIVGLEGLWGSIACTLLLIPVYYIPADSWLGKHNFHEDSIDTIDMIGNKHAIGFTSFIYVFAILGYNLFGMLVTQGYTAVHRTILEAVRTLCIWCANLIIYQINDCYGEFLTSWSILEAVGFVSLLIGLFTYNKVVKFPMFKYPEN
eukprot:TRINITY_DN10976_c0_g1_i1.p1 TRINITY_DN10976_c0_g1~~TRINITY_DN10976_c0_g1_i1.p1  ORF type:complete len:382 (-),score=88.21 TRINITY_DN10976_c0_g1_i1:334-1479(-)